MRPAVNRHATKVIPIHQLLSRIRHDPEFGAGQFEIGYRDRFDSALQRVSLGEVRFPIEEKRCFEFMDTDGRRRRVPLHRVRVVWRDGEVIWERV